MEETSGAKLVDVFVVYQPADKKEGRVRRDISFHRTEPSSIMGMDLVTVETMSELRRGIQFGDGKVLLLEDNPYATNGLPMADESDLRAKLRERAEQKLTPGERIALTA